MSDPRHHSVRVRRSPKVGVFLAAGAIVGAVVAVVVIGTGNPDPQMPAPQALGFALLALAPLGALAGGAVALVIDRAGERRARVVRAERIAGDGGETGTDTDRSAETPADAATPAEGAAEQVPADPERGADA